MNADICLPDARPLSGTSAAVAEGVAAENLGPSIRRIAAKGETLAESMKQVVRLLMQVYGIAAAACFRREPDGQIRALTPLVCRSALASQAQRWEPALRQNVGRVCNTAGSTYLTCFVGTNDLTVCAIRAGGNPIADAPVGAICLATCREQIATDQAIVLAQLVAAEIALAFETPSASTESPCVDPVDDLLADIRMDGSLGDIAHRLANHLKQVFGVSQVNLGTVEKRSTRCRLRGVSGLPTFAKPSPLVTHLEELMVEAVLRGQIKVSRAMDGHHNSVAEKQLFDLCHAKTMISGPLCPIAQPAEGAWVLLHDDWIDDAQQRRLVADATRLASQVASLVGLIRRAQPGPLVRFARHVAGQQRSIVFGLIAVGLLLLVPWPYRITCDCELLPLKRRYIPAPYDGVLKQVSVQPGDLVAEGQVLARMDGQEIDWQLAAHQADYMRASKEHDASLANRNTAAAQVARLEMERLDVQIELLRNRAHNLEIKSPMGGIVLSGDPREMEGARLTMGQNLFEVGPLEEMIVELFVPDHEITYVQPGQQVRLRFDAYPHRILTATVRRVSPRAETRDQKNVFVAEVVLANPQKLLRPGMVGRSRIATGLHPLGWNLFHRPAEQLVRLILW